MKGPVSTEMAKGVNRRLVGLVAAVAAGGLALIAVGCAGFTSEALAALLLLAALGAVGERLEDDLFGDSRVSVGMTAVLAAAALSGLWGVALVAPILVVAAHAGTDSAWYKRLFNLGTYALAAAPLVGLMRATGLHATGADWPQVLAPVAMGSLAAYAVNSGLVATAIGVHRGESVSAVWREKHRWIFPHYLLMGFAAIALASAYDLLGLWGFAVFVLPVLGIRQALHQYTTLSRESALALRSARLKEDTAQAVQSALGRVLASIDGGGASANGHSPRVVQLCHMALEEMGVEPDSRPWLVVEQAAMLHDLGLLMLPREPFAKRGPLSEEEWTQVRRHPEVVHAMLAGDAGLRQVAEVIHAHHERFDGGGYPAGRSGESIPLEARVLAVAEAVDAMLAGRPYRQPLPLDAVLAELERCGGSQFDPTVVEAFRKVLSPLAGGRVPAVLTAYPLAS